MLSSACVTTRNTYKPPEHATFEYPAKDALVEATERPYTRVGTVRSKVNFPSLDFKKSEAWLCRNYYNKAVSDLVKLAKEKGADAVIDVRSVVFYENGSSELMKTPECSDDGREGQILAQGLAVKWLSPPPARPAPKTR